MVQVMVLQIWSCSYRACLSVVELGTLDYGIGRSWISRRPRRRMGFHCLLWLMFGASSQPFGKFLLCFLELD